MTEDFSMNESHVVQTEILVLRKELINKEQELQEIANERIERHKNLESHVYKKYIEKLSTIKNEMLRRLDKVRLEIHNLITNTSSFMDGEQDREETSDREVLRLKRIIADREDDVQRLKLDIDANEEEYALEIQQLQEEADNLKEILLSEKENGESETMKLLKKQLVDLNEEVKNSMFKVEEEKKRSQTEKNQLEGEIKKLHIDFEDLTNSSSRKVNQLKLELQKKENEFIILQQEETGEKEDVEDLHRNYRAALQQIEDMRREKTSSKYLQDLIHRIQTERDAYLEQLRHARASKITLIRVLSDEIENMRDELKDYRLGGYKKDPTQRRKQKPPPEVASEKPKRANTVEITTNISSDDKYEYEESAYVGLGLDSLVLKPPPVIEDL